MEVENSTQRTAINRLRENLRPLLSRLEIDRAVVFLLLTRAWQMLAGPVTILLIARYFSPEMQGFYYTFASLLALQSFVELGFNLVIINVASHEWSLLKLDSNNRIEGDPQALSRLVSLGRLIFKWYAAASLIFIVGVGSIGYLFFNQAANTGVQWQAPWITLVILTGLLLWALPFNALLEGCNQVTAITRLRLNQVVLESLALWTTMIVGLGLWMVVIAAAVKLIRDLYLILIQYRHFFQPFLKPPTGARIYWKTEIWPMQWRIGLQGLVNYFGFSLFTPVMFQYHGTVLAGQMGMTWQIIFALQAVAGAWLHTKVPRFGMLIAQKDYPALDRFWLRTSLVSLAVIICGSGSVWLLIYVLNLFQVPLAQRMLPPLATGLFFLATIFNQVIQCLAVYLRAHKREPLVVMGVVTGLLFGLCVLGLGSRFGATGAAIAYLLVTALIAVPWIIYIWMRARVEWH